MLSISLMVVEILSLSALMRCMLACISFMSALVRLLISLFFTTASCASLEFMSFCRIIEVISSSEALVSSSEAAISAAISALAWEAVGSGLHFVGDAGSALPELVGIAVDDPGDHLNQEHRQDDQGHHADDAAGGVKFQNSRLASWLMALRTDSSASRRTSTSCLVLSMMLK